MRRLKRRAALLALDAKIAWLKVRFGWWHVKVWVHCRLFGITVEEFHRERRLRRLRGC